jgi:hypothetical protein
MPGGLVILADRESIARLRRDSGCRRLSGGDGIDFVAIDEIPWSSADLDFEERQRWSGRLGAVLGPDAPPIVLVWRKGTDASGDSPKSLMDGIRRFADRAIQADRAMLRLCAVIAIHPDGVRSADVEALVALAKEYPVYLANGQTRLTAAGPAWRTGDVWPVAVGRLLGSLALSPDRQRGLRAWRALAVVGASREGDSIDAAASKLARQVISGIDDDSDRDGLSTADLEARPRPLDVPDDRVAVDGIPQHSLDGIDGTPSRRPELPSWWELAPSDRDSAMRGSACFESEARLDLRAGSRWQRAFSKRGARFVRDRFSRAKQAALAILGPGSVHARAWERMHGHPRFVAWHAKGAFFKRPADRAVELIASQRLAWSRIREADAVAERHSAECRAIARELDEARVCSPSLLVRCVCLVAAMLFACAVVGVVVVSSARTRGYDPLKWSMITGLAAWAGAMGAAAILLYLEWRSGQRARDELERSVRRSEAQISDAFHARVVLGAEGELLQRRTAWLQSAARVRDTADRLHVLIGAEERSFLREEGNRSGPGAQSIGCMDFREATSVGLDPPVTADRLSSALLERDPGLIDRERAEYLCWWREALRRLDPAFGGGIVASAFAEAYGSRLGLITGTMRAQLLEELERIPEYEWRRCMGPAIVRAVGSGDDVPGLSCVTHRARGFERHRVIRVHAPTEASGRAVGQGIQGSLHGDAQALLVRGVTDGWGALVLVLDEISVSLESSAEGVDGGVRVMEGVRRG